MRKFGLLAGLLCCSCYAAAQDTLAGYVNRVEGETMGYTSYSPMANHALLTRTNTGQGLITWETEPVPAGFKGDTAYFTWVGGNAAGTLSADAPFDLSINGVYALTIVTHKDYTEPGWFYANDKGVSIRFEKKALDPSNDVSGRVTLAVPRAMLTPGKPLRLTITGQKRDNQDWFMVYQYRMSDRFLAEVLPLLERSPSGDTLRVVRIYGAYKKNQGVLHVEALHYVRDFPLHGDYNELQWALPYHSGERSIVLAMTLDGKALAPDTLALTPLLPLELHLVHHSHTDIGYSNLQQNVAAIQNNNIRKAIDLINRTKDYPEPARFRWNIESLWAVENFLDSASADEVTAFGEALRTGRMTLQAFYANELTGLLDAQELTWLTAYARTLENRFHVHVRSAMITDVPGYTWSTIQALQRAGIHYFSIGPNNSDRIGGVLSTWGDKPFYWKVPGSDEKVLTDVAGSSYSWFHGSAGARDPQRLTQRLVAYVRHLNEEGYPYKYALVRYNIVSDNAPLDTGISDFVRTWNDKYLYPKLVLSTPEMALGTIERAYGPHLPVKEGDMSPYWEDGAASTAMELGLNRNVRARLEQTEVLQTLRGLAVDPALAAAWRGVVMFDEHTWGAWCSITDPDNPFTVAQWLFKKNFLTVADSLEQSLRATATQSDGGAYRIVNTHSWETAAVAAMPDQGPVMQADGTPLVQQLVKGGKRLVYLPRIPGFGRVVLAAGPAAVAQSGAMVKGYTVQNAHLRLRIDSVTGAIASLVVKGHEIVQRGAYGINQYEYVPGRDPADAETAHLLHMEVTENGPLVTEVHLECEAPGARALRIVYRLDNIIGSLTIVDSVDKERVRTKEAVHFAFPFSIPGANLVADNGSFPYRPFVDTLAGGNRDFGYVGKWLDLSAPGWGVTLCPLSTPIMEWGHMRSEVIGPGSSVSPWKKTFAPTQTLFSYAMNNYWHTNYKADQEGWAAFTYVLAPHGPRNLADCYKTGEEAEAPPIALRGETHAQLQLSNAVIGALIPLADDKTWVDVYNPSPSAVSTTVSAPGKKLYRSNIHQEQLAVLNGPISLKPFERVALLVIKP